jgi:hypothetical protein
MNTIIKLQLECPSMERKREYEDIWRKRIAREFVNVMKGKSKGFYNVKEGQSGKNEKKSLHRRFTPNTFGRVTSH